MLARSGTLRTAKSVFAKQMRALHVSPTIARFMNTTTDAWTTEAFLLKPATALKPMSIEHIPSPAGPEDPISSVTVSYKGKRTAVTTISGRLYMSGQGSYSELGLGKGRNSADKPTLVEGIPPVRSVAMGEYFTVAVTEEGDVYTWGKGGNFFSPGALGHGNSKDQHTPALVKALEGINVEQIAAGQAHALALTEDGRVFSWGSGEFGRLGHGDASNMDTPTQIVAFAEETVNSIACGNNFSAAVSNNGLFTWGRNDNGQLGVSNSLLFEMYNLEVLPTAVQFPEEPPRATSPSGVDTIAVGPKRVVAYNSQSGTLYGFGNKLWTVPTVIPAPKAVRPLRGLACGKTESAIVDSEGHLYIWSGSEELTLFAGFSDHESAPVGSIDSISSSNNIVLFVNTNPAYLKTLQK